MRSPVLNDIECIFKQGVKSSNRAMSWNGWNISTAVPSLACILMKQHGVCGGKYLLKTRRDAISETLNFKMSLQ